MATRLPRSRASRKDSRHPAIEQEAPPEPLVDVLEQPIMKWISALVLSLGLAFAGSVARAEPWPTRPVSLVVPAPPGGNIDIAARIVGSHLQTMFGQPFIIENKGGAGGKIATEYVRSTGSDHTLLFTANLLLFTPLILGGAAYDWQRDFIPVGPLSFTPMVVVVHPRVQANTLKELLDVAKQAEGRTLMASPGVGTSNNLVSEMLQMKTGIKWTTVQYRGNAPATTDVIAGVVNFQFDQISSSLPHINSGMLRAIAVTSKQRLPSLPNVPTFEEEGFKGFEAETFTGLFAPAGTSGEVVGKLGAALLQIAGNKAVADRLAELGSQARGMTPAEFSAYLQEVYAKWSDVIRQANIKAN